jgi:hypothetical protein
MGGDDVNSAENARNKRWKSLQLIANCVGLVAMLGALAVIYSHDTGWSRSARRGWQDFCWLVYGCSTVCNLIGMQKRTDLKAPPSPLSSLDLSRRMEGPAKPIRSDHWSEGSSEAP